MQITNKKISSTNITISKSDPRDYDVIGVLGPITIPKGLVGTSFTKTGNGTGSVTLPSGHGLTTNNYVDVYWSGGQRQAVKISVSGTTITFVSASPGDFTPGQTNFPDTGTSIVVSKTIQCNDFPYFFKGGVSLAAWQFEGVGSTDKCSVMGQISDNYDNPVVSTGTELTIYDVEGGDTFPFTASLGSAESEVNTYRTILLSNGSTTADATFRMLGAFDNS